MTKYHINPETERVNICRAQNKCQFTQENGKEALHFDSKEDAKKFIEKSNAKKYSSMTTLKKTSKTKQELNTKFFSKNISSPNQEQIDEIVKNMYEENQTVKENVSADEYSALYAYAGNAYESINKTLRGLVTEKDKQSLSKKTQYEQVEERIKSIDKVMDEYGNGEGKETKKLYRYYRLDKKQKPEKFIQENLKTGETLSEKGYMSTTEDLAFVLGHINRNKDKNNYIIFEIATKKGVSLQDKEKEKPLFIQSLEKERLLPRDMKLQINYTGKEELTVDESRENIHRKFNWDVQKQEFQTIDPQNLQVVRLIDEDLLNDN